MNQKVAYAEIQDRLATIASLHGVVILYACESGSRVWGFDSPDSDYDIRFVFAHRDTTYLSLSAPAEDLNDQQPGNLYDYQGWDIFKFLRLVRKSNPSALEWLNSPLCYRAPIWPLGHLRDEIRRNGWWSMPALMNHYYSLAKGQYQRYVTADVEKDGGVIAKKILYVIRPLAVMHFIQDHIELPPSDFQETVAAMLTAWSDEEHAAVNELVRQKKSGEETGRIPMPPVLDALIQREFAAWGVEQKGHAWADRPFPHHALFDATLEQTLKDTLRHFAYDTDHHRSVVTLTSRGRDTASV